MDRGSRRVVRNRALEAHAAASDNDLVWSAVDELLAPLAKVAALVAGVCALAYICGWRYLDGYFDVIGASWVMALVSPVAMMSAAVPVLFAVLSLVASGLVTVYINRVRAKTFFRWGLLFGACWVLFACFYFFTDMAEEAKHFRFGFIAFGTLFLSLRLSFSSRSSPKVT